MKSKKIYEFLYNEIISMTLVYTLNCNICSTNTYLTWLNIVYRIYGVCKGFNYWIELYLIEVQVLTFFVIPVKQLLYVINSVVSFFVLSDIKSIIYIFHWSEIAFFNVLRYF